jgi:hypothetical protein
LPTYDVFISHNFADQRLAIELNDAIGRAGLRTFLAQDELPRVPSGGVHSNCDAALAESRAAIICIGTHGVGNSQAAEVDSIFFLANKADRKLPVWVMLLGTDARLDDIPADRPWLGKQLAHFYPNRPGEPGYRQILAFLEKTETKDVAERVISEGPIAAVAAFEPEAERAADSLAESVRNHGLTIFLGSLWPDRDRRAIFNPAEVAKALLEQAGIPVPQPHHVMSLERAAVCYSLVKGLGRRAQVDADIVKIIGKSFSLLEPECYAVLAALAAHYSKASATKASNARPLLFATTNFDRLFERALVKARQPFLRLSTRLELEGGVAEVFSEQVFFEGVEATEEDGRRIWTSPEYLGPGSQRVETSTQPFDRESLERPSRATRVFRERQQVLDYETDQTIWSDLQIDLIINDHAKKAGLREDERGADSAAGKIRRHCIRNGIPIVFKVLGCIDSKSAVHGFDRMLQFSGSQGWIPQTIQDELVNTASLFLGYGLADLRFVHLFEEALRLGFAGKRDRTRVFVASEDGPDDLNHAVDRVIMHGLHNRAEERFPGITFVKDVRPRRFVQRLMNRDLVEDEEFS